MWSICSYLRFADMYGDQTLKIGEEDLKSFDMWMDSWMEHRQVEVGIMGWRWEMQNHRQSS